MPSPATVRSTLAGAAVTTNCAVPRLPAASRALTVMRLTPLKRGSAGITHGSIPRAVPPSPRSFTQVTALTSPSSLTVPETVMLPPAVATEPLSGAVIRTAGAAVSGCPGCVTVKLRPAIVTVPARGLTPGFGSTV